MVSCILLISLQSGLTALLSAKPSLSLPNVDLSGLTAMLDKNMTLPTPQVKSTAKWLLLCALCCCWYLLLGAACLVFQWSQTNM
jgi:hypothetical protein